MEFYYANANYHYTVIVLKWLVEIVLPYFLRLNCFPWGALHLYFNRQPIVPRMQYHGVLESVVSPSFFVYPSGCEHRTVFRAIIGVMITFLPLGAEPFATRSFYY